MRYGRQRWKLKGKIEVNGKQSWDGEEMVFLPLIVGLISIKVCMLTPLAAGKAGVKNLPSHAPSAKTQKQIIKLSRNEPLLVFLTHLLKCCSIVQFRCYKTNQFLRAVGEIFFSNWSLSITCSISSLPPASQDSFLLAESSYAFFPTSLQPRDTQSLTPV